MAPIPISPKKTEFTPAFDASVYVTFNGHFIASYNPIYCLTPVSAEQLKLILADLGAEVLYDYPVGPTPPFTPSAKVPWLRIKGVTVNAGLMANYWNHGYPPDYAEQHCRADIAQRIADFQGQ